MLNPNTMVYARLGVEAFKYAHSLGSGTMPQYGLGVQTKLTNNWDVRGEYVCRGNNANNNSRVNLGFVYKLD